VDQSQLIMVRKNLDDIPETRLPRGYRIRFYEDGDHEPLASVFRQCFDPGWSTDRVLKTFVEDPVWSPYRMCVLCHGREVVGTATAWESRQRPGHGMLHYLAVLPAHRGKRLGLALAARVLELLKGMGYADAWLSTDDFRLPAIHAYLALGFEPVHTDKTHAERWQIVRHKLNASSPQ
jgi:GNAT superfamily N-acetyltransferase